MKQKKIDRDMQTAYHEAGHAYVYIKEFPGLFYESFLPKVTIKKGISQGVSFLGYCNLPMIGCYGQGDFRSYREGRNTILWICSVLAAGRIAQEMHIHNTGGDVADAEFSDKKDLADMKQVFSAFFVKKEFGDFYWEVSEKTLNALTQGWQDVEHIANRLLQKVTLNKNDIAGIAEKIRIKNRCNFYDKE